MTVTNYLTLMKIRKICILDTGRFKTNLTYSINIK